MNELTQSIREGVYVGPAGQLVLVEWDDGPGCPIAGGLQYSVCGTVFRELRNEIQHLLSGYEYLGRL